MDNLELGVGWTVDNDALKKGMDESRKAIEGVGQSTEVVERKINESLGRNVSGLGQLRKSWDQLKIQAEFYQRIASTSLDPKVIAEYNLKLKDVHTEMARIRAMGKEVLNPKVSTAKWDGLGNSINQITRELPAFTYSLQTGLMAITNNVPIAIDEINRLRTANQELAASGQKTTPVWKQVLRSLLSWNTALMVGATVLTVYGKEIGEWVMGMFNAKKQINSLEESQKALNEALKGSEYKDAVFGIKKLEIGVDMARRGIVSKKSVVEEYNKTLGKTTGEVKTLDEVERFLVNNADNYIKMTMYKAAANLQLAEAAKKAAEIQENSTKKAEEFANAGDKALASISAQNGLVGSQYGVSTFDTGAYVEDIRKSGELRKKEREKQLADEQSSFENNAKELLRKAQESASKMGISVFGNEGGNGPGKKVKDSSNLYQRIANGRQEMLDKISELDREYARKQMQSDEAELQALKDKFSKFRKIIEDENKEILRANEKNKGKKGYKPVELIDVGQVDPIEQRATEQVVYDQETQRIHKEIERRKQLFVEYEDYRTKLGKQKADERYGSELQGFRTMAEYMDSLQLKESQTISLVDSGKATEGQEKRIRMLEKESDDAKKIERQKQVDLLALMVTYDQKRKDLISGYISDRSKVLGTATDEELAELDRRHAEELDALDDANIQKLDAYKELFSGIEDLSTASAKQVIANAKVLLDGTMSKEQRQKILKALQEAEDSILDKSLDKVSILADEFDGIARSVGQVNDELGNMLANVGNVLRATVSVSDGIRDLKKGINDYSENRSKGGGGILGTISGIAGIAGPVGQIVGAVGSVVSGVIGFFKASEESARQAAKAIREYQESLITGELEYNRILRERQRIQGNIHENTIKELQQQRKLLEVQLQQKELRGITYTDTSGSFMDLITGKNRKTVKEELTDYEYALKKIQAEGQQVTGKRTEKYGGFLGIGQKTRVVDITAGLMGKTYEDLEKLYTEGKMTESTRALFENLRKAKDEVDDINELMKEIDEAILDKMSGGITAESISSPILQGIREGKRGAKDFADYSRDIIQEALLSAMNATVLEEPLRELVRKFREDASDGLDQDEIAAFQKAYSEVVQQGLDAVKDIEKLTGQKIGGSTGGSISGRVNQSITETTGSAILGFERARYDLAKRQLEAVMKALEFEQQSQEQILQSVRHLKAIEENTGNTVKELQNMKTVLESINRNTGTKGRTSEGMGL